MIYTLDNVYRGTIAYFSSIAPSGVTVVEGENFGIRLEDPRGKNPSLAVNIEEIHDEALELGSQGTAYIISCTVNALSRLQRDALKQIVYSGLSYGAIPFYSQYTKNNVPVSGALLLGTAEVQHGIRIRDMPDFSGRGRFYWSAVVFFSVHCLLV